MREVPAWAGPFEPEALPDELLGADRPFVVRGAFAHWPVVQAARQSEVELARYLMGFYNGVRMTLFELAPQERGRVFYADDTLSSFNFRRHAATLDQVLTGLLGLAQTTEPIDLLKRDLIDPFALGSEYLCRPGESGVESAQAWLGLFWSCRRFCCRYWRLDGLLALSPLGRSLLQ